jgi:hypothetical protein
MSGGTRPAPLWLMWSIIPIICRLLAQHGETEQEREDARILLVVVDARQPTRSAPQRDHDGEVGA